MVLLILLLSFVGLTYVNTHSAFVQLPMLTHIRVSLSKGCARVQSCEDSQDVLQTMVCGFKSRGARVLRRL